SVHGAFPFAADPCPSNLVISHFTSCGPVILNCTIVGRYKYPYFKTTTDASLPGYTAINNDGNSLTLIERKDHP
ncbi:hypothetical protein B0H19DRAFT_900528, partial [Mycena capillaripes]